MTKARRVLFGIASFLPVALALLWMLLLLGGIHLITDRYAHEPPGKNDLDSLFDFGFTMAGLVIFIYMLLFVGIIFAVPALAVALFLVIWYSRDAARTMDDKGRVVWITLLVAGNVLVFPVYWWLYIKSERSPQKEAELPI